MAPSNDVLRRLIDAVDYVSFDIFDTAILRRVARPEHVFDLVAHDHRIRNPEAPELDFPQARISAEAAARKHVWQESGRAEVTLAQIYQQLHSPPGWESPTLLRLECEMERELCVRNPYVFAAYEYARSRGKRVAFTSDMYLPLELIQAILADHDYRHVDGLFLSSSSEGATKANGALYRLLIERTGLRPDRILHIGDNYQSDVLMARASGLLAHHYEKCAARAPNRVETLNPTEHLHRGIVNNRLYSWRPSTETDDFWSKFGYEVTGVLYFGFVSWLVKELQHAGVERVFFLARDGWILKEVYDRFKAGPPSSYLFASRRALNVPAIRELDRASLDFLSSGTSLLQVSQFLGRIGLDAEEHMGAITEAGFGGASDLVSTGADYERLRKLFQLISPTLHRVVAEERKLLLAYLRQENITSIERAAVVDLGWHGSLQRSLVNVLQQAGVRTQIDGYYLGTFGAAQQHQENGLRLHGYLFENGQPARREALIRTCVEIVEFMHLAPHGSVLGFSRAPNGDIVPVLAEDDAEPAKRDHATRLQRSALQFIDDMLPVFARRPWLQPTPESAIAPLSRVLRRPTKEEAIALGDLAHAEGFGSVFKKRFIAKPPDLGRLLRNPGAVLDEMESAFWKEGYKTRILGTRPWLRRIGERGLARFRALRDKPRT